MTDNVDDAKFEQWAIVDLFGHTRLAGLITEQTIGGCSFVRIDIPGKLGARSHTELYGQGAIYGIKFVDEEIARAVADRLIARPVDQYTLPWLREEIRADMERRIAPSTQDEDDDIPY